MDIENKLSLAFKYFQEGNMKQTEHECLEILQVQPDNSDILHLLGVTCYHLGEHHRAVEFLTKALQLDDQNSDVHYDLGNIFQDQGKLDEALKAYQRALEIEPEHPDAHNNIAMVFHDLKKLDQAIVHYQKALELTPQSAMIHNNIGLACQENGELAKAIAHFGRAIQLDPSFADTYFNMGNVFVTEDNLDTALQYYRKSLELNPNLIEAYVAMADILMKKGEYPHAIPVLRRLLTLYPDSAELHNNLGKALGAIWQLDTALEHLKRAVKINPDFAAAHSNLGNTFRKIGKLDVATEHINNALHLDPEMIEAISNLGALYKEKGQFSEAIACYRRALNIDPENAVVHLDLALLELFLGHFKKGWEEYEWRWKSGGAQMQSLPYPLWDGSLLKGKKVFLYPEQRIGDDIMFASCIAEVITQAEVCVLKCDARLVPLYERSFPGTKIIGRVEGDRYPPELPPPDFTVPVGSLPRILRPDLASFPQQNSYLVPDETKVEEWRSRYSDLGEGLKVGISWRGGATPDDIRIRSTKLERWADLFAVKGMHCINLQYGDCEGELNEAKEKLGVKIHFWKDADPLKDLDAFAAQIAALDLVISVDNPTVHIAGALGIPAWVLLPSVCDWRWMQDFEDTPWYESIRLFRQEKPGEWDVVFESLLSYLRESAAVGRVADRKISRSYKDGMRKADGN
ncbi:MAG: tetratricopeptide repeat protein [Thermodesulfovibrionales bacterium]|nr:tetratricopeptide repeat protein [Thermodesulfovibrionales bacterium]